MTEMTIKLHQIAQAYGFERDATNFPAPARIVKGSAEQRFLDFLLCGEAFDAWNLWKDKGPFKLDFDEIAGKRCELAKLIEKAERSGVRETFPLASKDLAAKSMCLSLLQAAGLFGKSPKFAKLMDSMTPRYHGGRDPLSRPWQIDDLPLLVDGKLERPELLQAVTELSRLDMSGLYDEILCWVSPEMLRQHSSKLRAFRLEQMATLYVRQSSPEDLLRTELTETINCPLSELQDLLINRFGATRTGDGDLDFSRAKDFVISSISVGLTTESRRATDEDALLVKAYGCELFRHGLGGAPDRVLCAASRIFLETFAQGPCRPGHVDILRAQLQRDQFDLVIYKHHPDISDAQALAKDIKHRHAKAGRDFCWDLGGDPGRLELMRHLLPPGLQRRTIADPYFRAGEKLYISRLRAMQNLQAPTTGWTVAMEPADLDRLAEDKVWFAPGTRIQLEFSVLDPLQTKAMAYEKVLRLSKMPVTLGETLVSDETDVILADLKALKRVRQGEYVAELSGLVRWRGVDHYAKRATTEDDWQTMIEIFSYSGLKTVHHMIPRHMRVKEAGRVLSL
ncbi:hypothetical protein ACYPKM_01280 [Pseudomonas aeruginosa]